MMKKILQTILVFCLSVITVKAHDVEAPYSIEHYQLEQLSEKIYVVHGSQRFIGPENRGFMNNPAAVLTEKGIIIIDPGSSAEIGKQLLEKISQVSDAPVIAVFNTHVHGDHWLGNHGIRQSYPNVPIYAHQRMIERIHSGEGEDYNQLLLNLTEGATQGTQVVAPNIGLEGGEELLIDGVKLKIHHTGHAHTDHDIMIEVVDDKGLFFGDIVANKRVPNSDVPDDASFKGSINAIEQMLANDQIKIFIPGHGNSGGRDIPVQFLAFLEALYNSVTKYYDEGLMDYEMKDKVIQDMDEYKDWHNFIEIGRVINAVYQEIEEEDF